MSSSRLMQRMNVVLPEPEAPISTTPSPRRTCSEMPLRISRSPNDLCMSSASMISSSLLCAISTPPQQFHGAAPEHPPGSRWLAIGLAEALFEPALEKAPDRGQQQEVDRHH